jgi:hypothetical protein
LVVVVVVPAAIALVVFAAPFVRDRSTLPFGRDTAGYVWRANVAHDVGLAALRGEPVGFGDRPGHPSVVAVLRSLTGQDGLAAAWMMPAAMAAAVALAAGAIAAGGPGGTRRAALAAAAGVGGSAFIAWTAVGYAANLMFDVVALAFVAVVIHSMRGGPGSVAASAILLAGGVTIHWVFALLMVAMVVGVVIAHEVWPAHLLPRGSAAHPRRPLVALVASLVAGGGAMLLVPELPGSLPSVEPTHIENFNALRLDGFDLPLVVGAALVGLGAGLLRRGERWGVALLASWAIPAGAGLIGWSVLDLPTPPYRWIGFALGLPLLASLSGPWLRDLIHVRSVPGRAVLGVAALIPAGLLVVSGAQVWWARSPRLAPEAFAELGTVTSYLETSVPQGTPLLFSIRPERPPEPVDLVLRAGLPGSRAVDTAAIGLDYRGGLGEGPIGQADAVVLHLLSFRPRPPPAGTPIGPGAWVLQGPSPQGPVEPGGAPRAPGPVRFAAVAVGWLAVLGLAGSGWTRPLGVSVVEGVGLAPAFGIASIAVASVIAGRFGVRPAGWGALSILAAATAIGWAVAALRPATAGRYRLGAGPSDDGAQPGE